MIRTVLYMQPVKMEDRIFETGDTEENRLHDSSKGRILVDPGHGGRDPGMIGVDGLEEKGINLEIARSCSGCWKKRGMRRC